MNIQATEIEKSVTSDAKSLSELKNQWDALKAENPQLRIRNAALELNVSELELLCTGLGNNVTRLKSEFPNLLVSMESVGGVMALSRNEQVVHEKHGIYKDFKIRGKGAMGLCLGEIDLRVFLNQWQYGFYVSETIATGVRESLQFFDREGKAIHKIYKTDNTDAEAWEQLVVKYTNESQELHLTITKLPEPEYPNNGKANPEDVINKWESLKDVHQFHGMLQKLGISRAESLRLAGPKYAQQLADNVLEETLTQAVNREAPIMLFVGNRGIVQIHTARLSKLLRTGPWFNVLDPDFNLHANTEEITSAWLVRRPSVDGTITSIEFYNAKEDIVLTLFGERKPGEPERDDWQALTAHLEENFLRTS